jgi:ABC-type sugar transport system ATPase subunit
VGSGAVDVVNALAGLVHNASGKILVGGRPLTPGSPARALKSNIMFISGDRAEEGIFRRLRVLDNLIATRLSDYTTCGMLRLRALRAAAASLAGEVGVDRRRLNSPADELSGGNQQKLAFGRCIDRGTSGVLVMNEPTRGIDVGARADIYRIMRRFCEQGYAVMMTSSDLEEIIGLGDTIITMFRGRQVGIYGRHDVTMARLVADITHPADELETAG